MLSAQNAESNIFVGLQSVRDDQSPLQADSTVAGTAPPDPLLGHTLDDKYRLEEQLGMRMGTVYRGRHVLIDSSGGGQVLNPRFVEGRGCAHAISS